MMPSWWQRWWRRRYPFPAGRGRIALKLYREDGTVGSYDIWPMECGCGYQVYDGWGDRLGHRATLGAAIRYARRREDSV